MRSRSFCVVAGQADEPTASTGRPTVRVPVLSRTIASRCASRSSASPPLKRTPSCAPRPTATVSAAGTARPMAQGQAMTSTATVFARASGSEWAARSQARKVRAAKAEDHGDKDGTGAVGQPLHGRARALRLLDHARDLRQDRGFAERLRPADHGAVVVERAGQDAAADFARQRRGFAGEHGFIDSGAAFNDGGVHREALAGKNQNVVAGLDLFKRHDGLHAVDNAARGYGAQAGERVERGQGAAFGAGFKALAQQQKSEDEQDRVEVDIAAGRGPEGGIGGVEQRRRWCPGRPACSCWWRRGAGRGWR